MRGAQLTGSIVVLDRATAVRVGKVVDTPPTPRDTLSPDQREYYMERRRALLTELKALNKLLGIKTE